VEEKGELGDIFFAGLIWRYELKGTKEENCIDCLHCKVSAKSTENQRLCFCAKAEKAVRHREPFWLGKKACGAFEGMGAPITNLSHASGKPLLKGIDFLDGLSCRGGY
jgi:hypothetical protein